MKYNILLHTHNKIYVCCSILTNSFQILPPAAHILLPCVSLGAAENKMKKGYFIC